MITLILKRITCVTLGAASAGVGCYAAWEAAARADGGYLMVAAPIVALAAALIPVYFDRAINDRQYLRGLALFVVWLPCVATVILTAVERVHLAKAGGEAQRAALHTTVNRAKATLAEAKAEAKNATAAADKFRGLDDKACKRLCLSAKANESAAARRVAIAEATLRDAESKAVTESSLKAPEYLLPLALEFSSMILIGAGCGLGRHHRAPMPMGNESKTMPDETPASAEGVEARARLETALAQVEELKAKARRKSARQGLVTRETNKAIKAEEEAVKTKARSKSAKRGVQTRENNKAAKREHAIAAAGNVTPLKKA